MKKIILYLGFAIIIYMMVGSVSSLVIPKEAIRIRVIANSNNSYDQEIKIKVKEQLQTDLYNLLKDIKGVEKARFIINNNLTGIDDQVSRLLKNENYPLDYKLSFGYNYFPAKEYNGIIYEEGYYESLVVTLGSGEGDNWWCVLFPPLCLLEAEENEDVEYTSFVRELIDKHL